MANNFLTSAVIKEIPYAIEVIEDLLPGWEYSITLSEYRCTIAVSPDCIGSDARLLRLYNFKMFGATKTDTTYGVGRQTILSSLREVLKYAHNAREVYYANPKAYIILSELKNRLHYDKLEKSSLAISMQRNGNALFPDRKHVGMADLIRDKLDILSTNPFLAQLMIASNGFYSSVEATYSSGSATKEMVCSYEPYLINCLSLMTSPKSGDKIKEERLVRTIDQGVKLRFRCFLECLETRFSDTKGKLALMVDKDRTVVITISGNADEPYVVDSVRSWISLEERLSKGRSFRVRVVDADGVATTALEK